MGKAPRNTALTVPQQVHAHLRPAGSGVARGESKCLTGVSRVGEGADDSDRNEALVKLEAGRRSAKGRVSMRSGYVIGRKAGTGESAQIAGGSSKPLQSE